MRVERRQVTVGWSCSTPAHSSGRSAIGITILARWSFCSAALRKTFSEAAETAERVAPRGAQTTISSSGGVSVNQQMENVSGTVVGAVIERL